MFKGGTFMEFIEFLKNRHLIINSARKLKDNSVRQYNSRLISMLDKKIYNGEKQLNEEIIGKINLTYANRSNEYERTLKYYIEYKNHLIKEKG
jgi:hypothetical protein